MSRPTTAGPHAEGLAVSLDGQRWSFPSSRVVVVGRDPHCDVVVPDDRVSRRHLELRPDEEGWEVADLGSRNGTHVDGRPQQRARLAPGTETAVAVGAADGPVLRVWCPPQAPRPRGRGSIVVGRDPVCDVVVDDPLASRRHALVDRSGGEGGAVLHDLDSFNGTYRNGRRIEAPEALEPGDLVGVGTSTLVWSGAELAAGPARRPSLVARHLTVTTGAGRVLLDDVSFAVPAGSVTAVIGPSGAGKSTLMGALTGLHPARRGAVTWNGLDLYAQYEQLRHLVGIVPQEDILHRQLTVRRALGFAARLRLPPDTGPQERAARVDEVLEEVSLGPQRDQRVDSLSGGQLKRTSMALELLTAPQLLFLDEPTSGLDPGLDRQVMLQMRALADAGRVVVVVTHSVLALDVCDRVLLMAPGGRVAFFGPPEQLLPFFGVQDHPAAFAVLRDPDWPQRYAGSPEREAYVGRTGYAETPVPAGDAPAPRRPAPLRQLTTLVGRNLAVAAADRLFLVLLVAMPLLLALMAHAFPEEGGLSVGAVTGPPVEARQRLLVLVVGAALMGTALAVRDLVAERPIYRREHAVGLSPGAYLASKVAVLGGLVAVQSVVFVLLALAGVAPPDDPLVLPSARLEVAAAVAAVGVVMTVAALAVSAAARSVDQTTPALVALVMAQIVFCGGLFDLAGRAGLEQLSWLLPARFGFAATAATVGLQPGDEPDPLFEPVAAVWWADLGLLGVQAVVFAGLASFALARSVARGGVR